MKIFVQRTSKRTLKICPQADGSVTVFAPRFLSQKQIASYIAENISWISEHLKKVATVATNNSLPHVHTNAVVTQDFDNLDNQTVKDIFAGKSVLLCGQLYACKPSSHSQTCLNENFLCICEKQFGSREQRLKCIKTFLKRMANSVLSQEISKVGTVVALCPTKIQFRDLRGLWCSCRDAEAHAIVLDYRVVQLPPQLQNYVIAHAFAHFVRQGHGDDFFQCLSNYIPNYRQMQDKIDSFNFLLDV